jgi:hypothetical protein
MSTDDDTWDLRISHSGGRPRAVSARSKTARGPCSLLYRDLPDRLAANGMRPCDSFASRGRLMPVALEAF